MTAHESGYEQLIEKAFEARKGAYAPYSHYLVGAALLTTEGKIITGCNIENASYGATNCAERTAIFKAVSEGERNFEAIAICGGPEGKEITDFAWPCGICRQVMREFCGPDLIILTAVSNENVVKKTLSEMLPDSFGPEHLA